MGAYAETYVDDAMANLGEAVDYAVYACGLDADEFARRFAGSHYANDFAAGVPASTALISNSPSSFTRMLTPMPAYSFAFESLYA